MNLFDYLRDKAEMHPDDTCFVSYSDGEQTTFGQLWSELLHVQNQLASLRTRRLIGIFPNSKKAAVLYLACLISGVDICILGEDVAVNELEKVLLSFDPDVIVGFSNAASSDNFYPPKGSTLLSLDHFFDRAPSDVGQSPNSGTHTIGRQIVSTSGSTGDPKMLALSGNKLWQSAQAFVSMYKLNHQNMFWNFLPMSYLGGTLNLLLIPIASGGTVLIDKSFGAESFLRFFATVNRFQINTIWLIPTIVRGLKRILANQPEGILKVPQKISFIGTAPSSFEERRWIEAVLGCESYENYGLTETTFLLAEPLRGETAFKSYGLEILPWVRAQIQKGSNTLRVKTPFRFDGYLSDSTVKPNELQDDWFDTGDVVKKDSDAFVFLGRTREIIKKGGTLINLLEIEKIMREIVTWGEVAAIPVGDDFYGENYVVLYEAGGDQITESFILGALSKSLSKTKMPIDVRQVKKIELTRSGKIDKRAALASYELSSLTE